MLKISMIDDDKIVRESVMSLMQMQLEIDFIKGYESAEDFLENCDGSSLQILLLDVGLPGISGIDAIPKILDKFPSLDIIILTTYEEEEMILKAIYNGACSYISKRAGLKAIIEAVEIVKNGGSYMSPAIARLIISHLSFSRKPEITSLPKRQTEILQHLVDGKSYAQMAEFMNISIETVRTHIKKLYKKLQVNNKTEAVAKFIKGEIS